MDDEEARTIGWRLRLIREARGKSLRVIAGLAGMSASTLHRIEHAEHAVTLSEIVALANALEIAPSELTKLSVPAPANGHTDSTTEAVRLALDAIEDDQPGGLALPVAALRDQVAQIHRQRRACRFAEVATDLPGLIRNLHTTLATGADHGELLDLAVYLHVHVTRLWLVHAAAPTDLVRRLVFLAQRLARERDEVTTLSVAGFGVVDGAAGEVDSLGFVFTPTDAGMFRMGHALEAGEADQAVSIAEDVHPERHPFTSSQVYYWVTYGRALAHLRGRRDDAVRALRTAEDIFPTKVRRDPWVREAVATLLPGAGRDAIGMELRGLAYRAGLPV